MERTTDLEKLKIGAPFTWGEVKQIHKIGEYTLVEYYEWMRKGSIVLTGQVNHTNTFYSLYINGKDICRGADSLDSALAECIAYKHDGINSQAGHYFMKMIENNF